MSEETKKLVRKCKIVNFQPIFRDGVEAERIHIATISWLDEIDGVEKELISGFDIIRQKGIDTIGEIKAYILPDTCAPDNQHFADFHRPDGDIKNSKLGGWMLEKGVQIGRRVRAKKFNNFVKSNGDDVYSHGLLLDVPNDILLLPEEQWAEAFGVVKFITEESTSGGNKGLSKGELPQFVRPATDEVFIKDGKVKAGIEAAITAGKIIQFRRKKDGSSFTAYNRLTEFGREDGVCSRNLEKKLNQKIVESYLDVVGNVVRKNYNKDTKELDWKCTVSGIIYTEETVQKLTPIETEVSDAFVDQYLKVKHSKGKTIQEALLEYCETFNVSLAISGELIGRGSNGSGNKNNPDRLVEPQVNLFDLFDISSGYKKRLCSADEHNLERFCEFTGIAMILVEYEYVFNSYDELVQKANSLFKEINEKEKIDIEGFVVRPKDDISFSGKAMNDLYDSKK